jgi:methionine aminotransferase
MNSPATHFTRMSALAAKHGAVNPGQGFPDFGCEPRLIDLVEAAMQARFNQYPLTSSPP